MKIFLLLISLFLIGFSALQAQDTLTIYYARNGKKTTKENADFYRKLYLNNEKKWSVSEYFLNNQLKSTGVYLSKNLKKKHGIFTFYHPLGNKKSTGEYRNNKQVGKWEEWYNSGQLKSTGMYDVKGNKIGVWKNYYYNGKIDSEGKYSVDSKMDGEWKWYHENGQISSIETYKNGNLQSAIYYNSDGTIENDVNKAVCEPVFPGGVNEMNKFIAFNTKYPEEAIQKKISGKINVKFFVDREGTIIHAYVPFSVNKLLEEEALRVVKSMPKWIPGKKHNRLTWFMLEIPINFKLN